jgi:FkbM family methyltransferase
MPVPAVSSHEIALPNGLTFQAPSDHMLGAARYVVKEIFRRRRYLRTGFEIGPEDTVVDIGANMGLFVLWAAPQCSRGRLIAVEPTSVVECIRSNVARNDLHNVTVVQAAMGKDGGDMEFVTYPGFNIVTHQVGWRPAAMTRFLIGLAYRRQRRQPVLEKAPLISLGRLLDQEQVSCVDLLKVDCEGGEYEIFRNATDSDWQRIRRIALEFHEYHPSQRHEELLAMLAGQGFKVEVRKPYFEYRWMKFGELWAWRA